MCEKTGNIIKRLVYNPLIIAIFVIPTTINAKLDLFIGCHCWLNTGPGAWQRKQAWDIPGPGSVYVHASFGDLDNDGDYDAYVTDDGGTIMAFKNTGSDTAPVWQRESAWDFSPGGQVFWADFVDINNDSKCELSIAKSSGVKFYQNTGTSSPTWVRQPSWDINVSGSNLGHTYADLDGDGDYDAMVRLWFINPIKAFKNIGTINNPIWQEEVSWEISPDQTLPGLGDIDGDGDADLIEAGDYYSKAFENTGTISNPVWTIKMSWLTSDQGSPIYPEFVDIDKDEAGVEEKNPIQSISGEAKLEVYPNPFVGKTIIRLTDSKIQRLKDLKIKIYDISGKLVKVFPVTQLPNDQMTKITWDGTDDYGKRVEMGIYFCNLQTGEYKASKKISLIGLTN